MSSFEMYQLNTVSFHPIITRKLPGISEERSYEFTVTYELLFKKCILIFNVLITFFYLDSSGNSFSIHVVIHRNFKCNTA